MTQSEQKITNENSQMFLENILDWMQGFHTLNTQNWTDSLIQMFNKEKQEQLLKFLKPYGKILEIKEISHHQHTTKAVIKLKKIAFIISLAYTNGKLSGLWFQHDQLRQTIDTVAQLPDNFSTFAKEKKIKIGANKEYPLEASIIIPKQQVTALVVFVHGSGALDKNERVGNVTPFFDLAIGLVKDNIASIRFDKRTYSHPLSLNKPDYTPYDEIIDDAISAAKTLLKQFSGQTIPLFLLGHSQGGTFLTQISKQIDMPVSGLILLAPPSSSALYPDALRQLQQFIAQHPDQKQDLQILIEQLETQILHWENYKKTQVKQGDFPLHLPASYLTFIESYSPVKEIKKVNHPTLLLQGEKDTQVLADTDFINWKLALQTSKKAKFFLYKDLTHLFTKNNAEDGMPHMEKQVIQDINHWILTTVQKIDLNNQSCLFDDSTTKP